MTLTNFPQRPATAEECAEFARQRTELGMKPVTFTPENTVVVDCGAPTPKS